MSGPGYRKRYTKVIEQGVAGHYPSANNALTLRHGLQWQEVCVPWVAGCTCFGVKSGQPHLFSGSGAPPGGQGSAGPVQRCRECDTVRRQAMHNLQDIKHKYCMIYI